MDWSSILALYRHRMFESELFCKCQFWLWIVTSLPFLPTYFLIIALWEFNRLLEFNLNSLCLWSLCVKDNESDSEEELWLWKTNKGYSGKFGITIGLHIKYTKHSFMDSSTTSIIIDHFLPEQCLLCCLCSTLVSKG